MNFTIISKFRRILNFTESTFLRTSDFTTIHCLNKKKIILLNNIIIGTSSGTKNSVEVTKPQIFLAILRDSKRVQFFYFGIGIVFLKSESKNCIESLKSDSRDSKRVFDTINLWNRNCLLDLRVQKLRIGLAWSCVESYRLVKDHQHEKIRIKSEA